MTKTERKKLNVLLHQLVRLRDGEQCLWCGGGGVLQLSHIYPKGKYRKLEFDPLNLKLLCLGCHLYKWHRSPLEAQEWLKTVIPPERLAYLRDMSNKIIKAPLNFKAIKEQLEEEIKHYERDKV